MRRVAYAALGLAVLLPAPPAAAVEPVAPPAIYPPGTWTGRAAAEIRVLDRLDAHVEPLTVTAGQTGRYKSLTISVRDCVQSAPGLPPDTASFVTVHDAHAGTPDFSGWMFQAEPFLGVFQSPVFGVSLAGCAGPDAPPAAPPLPPTQVPQLSDNSAAPGVPTGTAPGAPPGAVPGALPGALPGAAPPDAAPPSEPTPVFPSGAPEPPPPDDAPPPGN